MYRVTNNNLIKVSQIQNGQVKNKKKNTSFDHELNNVIKKDEQGLTYEQKCSVGLLSTEEYVKWMYERSIGKNRI